jgi:hypothetical protein
MDLVSARGWSERAMANAWRLTSLCPGTRNK